MKRSVEASGSSEAEQVGAAGGSFADDLPRLDQVVQAFVAELALEILRLAGQVLAEDACGSGFADDSEDAFLGALVFVFRQILLDGVDRVADGVAHEGYAERHLGGGDRRTVLVPADGERQRDPPGVFHGLAVERRLVVPVHVGLEHDPADPVVEVQEDGFRLVVRGNGPDVVFEDRFVPEGLDLRDDSVRHGFRRQVQPGRRTRPGDEEHGSGEPAVRDVRPGYAVEEDHRLSRAQEADVRAFDFDRDLGFVALGCALLAFPDAVGGAPGLEEDRLDRAGRGAAAGVVDGAEEVSGLVDDHEQARLTAESVFECRVAGHLADPEPVGAGGVEDPLGGLERVVLPGGGVADVYEEEVRALSGFVLPASAEEESADRQRGGEGEHRLAADRGLVDVFHDLLGESARMQEVLGQVVGGGVEIRSLFRCGCVHVVCHWFVSVGSSRLRRPSPGTPAPGR